MLLRRELISPGAIRGRHWFELYIGEVFLPARLFRPFESIDVGSDDWKSDCR